MGVRGDGGIGTDVGDAGGGGGALAVGVAADEDGATARGAAGVYGGTHEGDFIAEDLTVPPVAVELEASILPPAWTTPDLPPSSVTLAALVLPVWRMARE